MENNRNGANNNSYDYTDNNDYSSSRNSSPMRNLMTPKGAYLKPPSGSKIYYKTQGNNPQYYSEDQMRNMQARAVPNSSYSPNQLSHRQMVNQLPQTNSQTQGSSSRAGAAPLKGILVTNQKNNILEGQRRKVTARQYTLGRPKTPNANYKTATCLSNENSASFSGGEPISDNDDSQYYFIDEKNQQLNCDDNVRTICDEQEDDVSVYKDFGYNNSENELFYDPRDFAALDLRERPKQAFPEEMHSNNNHSNVESPIYENAENNYYRAPQPINVPRQSISSYGQMRYQNLPKNGILTQFPSNRRDAYKNVTEKLNETYNELKNASVSDKKESDRSQRGSSQNSAERYSLQERLENNNKYIQNTKGDYQNNRLEFKDGDLYTPISRHNYQHNMFEENFKRSTTLSHLDKYKSGNLNGLHNPNLRYPPYKTQNLSNTMERNMVQLNSNKQKLEDDGSEESGSYVHMHKEYKKKQPIPGCCVDAYNNFRKEEFLDK